MAFDPNPATWIPGWSADDTDIVIADAFGVSGAFPELSPEEANEEPSNPGDIRKVLFAICQALADTWYATDAADRPTKMTISRSSPINESEGTITRIFTFRFVTSVPPGSEDVEPE